MTVGSLITFEGCEGSGKSTQITLLERALGARRIPTRVVREPGGTPAGERIREILLSAVEGPTSDRAELLLYLAARAELTARVIRPALEEGRVVLSDRYIDASVAYQGAGRGLGVDLVKELNRVATGGLEPALTFVLDIDPVAGLARAAGRSRPDRLEKEALAFHERVRQAYRDLATEPRAVLLDASRAREELAAEILQRTLRHLQPA